MRRAVRRLQAGVSVIDVLLGASVMIAALSGLMAFLQSSIAGSRTVSERSVLARRANDLVRRIADELSMADDASLTPAAAPLGASLLDFRVPQSVAAVGVTWQNATRVEWQVDPNDPADGVDNDDDGVIDEGIVMLRRNVGLAGEQATILATNVLPLLEDETVNNLDDNGNGLVDETGLSFAIDANGMVTIRVTLFSQSANGLLLRTAEAAVSPRN